MDLIEQHVQQIASALVAVDVGDLAGMAKIHTLLQGLMADITASSSPNSRNDQARAATQVMLSSVERLVLGEAPDPVEAVARLSEHLDELQAMFNAEAGGVAAAPAAPRAIEPAAPTGGGIAIPEERPVTEADLPLVHDFITEANSHLDAAEAALLELESDPGRTESINSVFRSFHTIKGVAGFLDLKQIGVLAHCAESLLDQARQGNLALRGQPADVVLESLDTMRKLLQALSAALAAGLVQPVFEGLPNLVARLTHCASLKAAVIDIPAPAAVASTSAAEPAHASEQPKVEQPAAQEAARATSAPARSEGAQATVKIGTARLDTLVDLVGELLIAQSMVHQGAAAFTTHSPVLARRLSHLGKITRELQDLSMGMRMVPIQGVFQKMTRLVRDVGRKAGKKAELVTFGEETELDRNVVEAVSDPLVHMVRNSVDHGIEPPDLRLAAGKPEAGRIELRAFHQGGSIVIEIEDDGRGLNTEKIVRKAKEAGIVREGQVLSEQETFALIFHAGLSTAEKVTDVSGRGVGMDVVKRNIEALRGRIEIASTPGKGSRFTIRLPLTLAMIDGMVVRVGASRFIIPMTSIEQTIQPKSEQLSTVQGRGEMCLVRGRLLPLLRLSELFGLSGAGRPPTESLAVILQDNGRSCCMVVDELLGQQQVVIKSLGRGLSAPKGVAGGAILGDGTVSLIVEVSGLMDLAAPAGAEARGQNTDSRTRSSSDAS